MFQSTEQKHLVRDLLVFMLWAAGTVYLRNWEQKKMFLNTKTYLFSLTLDLDIL